MNVWISLLNDVSVSIFGIVLSVSFCDTLHTRRSRRIFWSAMAMLPFFQGTIYYFWDTQFLRKIYPLVVHLPLMVVLYILTRRMLWSAVSVMCAYLCCQLRRWIALLVAEVLSGGAVMQDIIELVVTVPVLLLLIRFVAPSVRKISKYPAKEQLHFGVSPALYYGFDYLTQVYTDLLYSGNPVIVEFMPFVCCVAYLAFLLYSSAKEQERSRLQQVQNSLGIQLAQAVREIDVLRESQALAARYRHDLRHHLQYLSSCIGNGQDELALSYISDICREIETQKVQRYCENEAANLILSAFSGRAKQAGITMNIKGTLPAFMIISDSDLCVLFSNAMENALHACLPFAAEGNTCTIDVEFYEQKNRLFLQIVNPCSDDIRFEKGIPVSDRPGHGIGVQSICAIVERYGGVYTFFTREGKFILRMSL